MARCSLLQAIAWSPHQHGLLASGGGTADRCIRFWNTATNTALSCIDTGESASCIDVGVEPGGKRVLLGCCHDSFV